jgi:hypothetical protein
MPQALAPIPKRRSHFLPGEAGEVSASYADLPSPKRSRFGFAQAGGGAMSFIAGAHDPSARYAGTSPLRNPQRGGMSESST